MGSDKAMLPWGKTHLLGSILEQLRPLSDDILVAGNIKRQLPSYIRMIPDIFSQQGPLSGIHAGLTAARHEYAFVTACDAPFPNSGLVFTAVNACAGRDGAVLTGAMGPEPLLGCYRRSCVPIIARMLTRNERKAARLLEYIDWCPVTVPQEWATFCLVNINTPSEYEAVRKWHSPNGER
jgi:molybdopterin-guanine dinucleotide biosynthesis protein A